jgi:hypothetical protein
MSRRDFRRIAKMAGTPSLPNLALVSSGTREMVVGSWVSQSDERCFKKRRRVASWCGFTRVGSMSMLAALSMVGACAPKELNAGEWQCAADGAGSAGAPPSRAQTDPVPVPWSDGFEDGFCDYLRKDGPGYCYGDAPYVVVTEPHRPGGRFAAEFKVIGDLQNQTRCVRQGELPEAAYYGAWYYIPEALQDVDMAWNLWHFQGGDDPDSQHDLWDVTLGKATQGADWDLMVLDRLNGFENYRRPDGMRIAVPIGSWFHIELFLRRRTDATGEIALYQDGVQLFDKTNLKSDASKFTQWYIGDWADKATPADSSLYVDDVSITAMPSSTSATQ